MLTGLLIFGSITYLVVRLFVGLHQEEQEAYKRMPLVLQQRWDAENRKAYRSAKIIFGGIAVLILIKAIVL